MEYELSTEELWDRAMSATTEKKRNYWLDRYQVRKEKVYQPKVSRIRKIDDILGDRQ